VSSPEGFTLPLMDELQDRESGTSLPLAAPPTIPLAPPPSIPVVPPGSIPLAPPTAIPVTAPVSLSPVRTLEEADLAPFTPPSAGDVGIVTVERGGSGQGEPEVAIDEVLLYLLEKGGSDLHLSVNSPPMIRVHGELEPVPGYRAMTAQQLQESVYSLLTDRQKQRFEETKELDLAYEMPGAARFRVNLMQQRGAISAVLRAIPWEILPLDALNMPPILGDFADLPRGLVLVTGPTGSGKSTTLAAIIDKANRTRKGHIITIEDPIEFVHQHRQCLVNQREVGADTMSFEAALKHALRQDPDIILVGEMRDLETIAIALTAAETGHLVFGTLHTSSAATTIDRIIDVFPPHQQQQVRSQLAMALQGVVCQTLAKTADGHGRVVATEVLVVTPAVRNLIREGKSHQIYSVMQAGAAHGMHTLDQHLADLVRTRRITYEVGLEKCHHIEDFNRLCGRA
jgi:twitching motility protein PilT